MRHGDAANGIGGPFDGILVNAGVTHPLDSWLDALAPGGRLMLPITATMPATGAHIGKGVALLVTRHDGPRWSARAIAMVAVYSAVGVRDDSLNERVGKALMSGPARWQAVTELRRDPHEPGETCWLHLPGCCFATARR